MPINNWKIPATNTAKNNDDMSPKLIIEAATRATSPAAGPDTANCDPLTKDTTIPPTIPDNRPEYSGTPDARAIPKHKGSATKNTDKPAGKSYFSQIIL